MLLVQPDLCNLLAFKMKARLTNIYPSFALLVFFPHCKLLPFPLLELLHVFFPISLRLLTAASAWK